jgi:hypothetical protein
MFTIYILDGSNYFKYNGESPQKGMAIGGSESAIIYMARNLAREFNGERTKVVVICKLDGESRKEYFGVEYRDYNDIADLNQPDILINQRGIYLLESGGFQHILGKYLTILWLEDNIDTPYLNSRLANSTIYRLIKNKILSFMITLTDSHTIGTSNETTKNYRDIPYKYYLSRNGVEPVLGIEDIEQDRFQILYPSVFERGIHILAKYFHEMRKEISWNLHIEGFSYSSFSKKFILQNGFNKIENMNFHEGLSKKELWKQWKKSRCFIYLGRPFCETSCITVMEGIANNRPTIHNKIAAVEETANCGIGIPFYLNEKKFKEILFEKVHAIIFDDEYYQKVIKNYDEITEVLKYKTIAYEWLCYFDYIINHNIHKDAVLSELKYNKLFNRRSLNYREII